MVMGISSLVGNWPHSSPGAAGWAGPGSRDWLVADDTFPGSAQCLLSAQLSLLQGSHLLRTLNTGTPSQHHAVTRTTSDKHTQEAPPTKRSMPTDHKSDLDSSKPLADFRQVDDRV